MIPPNLFDYIVLIVGMGCVTALMFFNKIDASVGVPILAAAMGYTGGAVRVKVLNAVQARQIQASLSSLTPKAPSGN